MPPFFDSMRSPRSSESASTMTTVSSLSSAEMSTIRYRAPSCQTTSPTFSVFSENRKSLLPSGKRTSTVPTTSEDIRRFDGLPSTRASIQAGLADHECPDGVRLDARHEPEFIPVGHEVASFGKSIYVVDLRIYGEAEGHPLPLISRCRTIPRRLDSNP